MANLSTTSTISVVFDIIMVIIVALSSPIQSACEESGGKCNVIEIG